MITINLKPGAKRQAPKGSALAGLREQFRVIGERVRQPGLVLAGGAWLVVVLVIGGLYLRSQSRVHTLQPKVDRAVDDYRRYKTFVTMKHREEGVRDSILAQIGTISAVDQDRYTWSHILDEIAGAVPNFTWLTTIVPVAPSVAMTDADTVAVPAVSVMITGQTNDLQNYTAFLRRLGESHWLTGVVPIKTETVIDKNRPITTFTVQATFMRADSSRIQTVPILDATGR